MRRGNNKIVEEGTKKEKNEESQVATLNVRAI